MIIFGKRIPVLYIGRDKLKFAYVYTGFKPSIGKITQFEWTPNGSQTFFESLKKISNGKLRLVIDSELSYVFTLNIPKSQEIERSYIFSIVSQEIPEKLNDNDWDFKVISEDSSGKRIVVFSPIHDVMSGIILGLAENGFEIEAVEPETISLERNQDSMIGIALKKDLVGSDENILNINEHFGTQGSKFNYFITFAATLFLLFVILGLEKMLIPKIVAPPHMPTATPVPVIRTSEIKLEIVNGSGSKIYPDEVKKYLEEKGYTDIKTADVTKYDYKGIRVEIKTAGADYYQRLLTDISEKYPDTTVSGILDKESVFDAILNLGQLK